MKTKFEVFTKSVAECLKSYSINVTEIRWPDAAEEIEEIDKIKRMQFLNCFGEGFIAFATDIDMERIVLEIHYEYNPFEGVDFIGLDWDIPVNLIEMGFPEIAKTLAEKSRTGYQEYILRKATELNHPGIVTNYLDALEESERVKVLDRYLDATMTSDSEMTMTLIHYKHERGMITDTGIGRL